MYSKLNTFEQKWPYQSAWIKFGYNELGPIVSTVTLSICGMFGSRTPQISKSTDAQGS